MNLLKFFEVLLEYTDSLENYTEPAATSRVIIENILHHELYSINNKKTTQLKCFTIYYNKE